jgi:HEAT repeat protein
MNMKTFKSWLNLLTITSLIILSSISSTFGSRIDDMISKEDVEGLIKILEARNESIVIKVIQALGKRGDKKAIKPLVEVIKNKEKSLTVKRDTAMALAKLGAIEPLIEVLKDKNRDDDARRFAAGVLGPMKDKRAIEPLAQALLNKENNYMVRLHAAWSLDDFKDERAVTAFIQVLEDKETDIRWSAAMALGKIGDKRAIRFLKRAVKDKEQKVREAAKKSLGEIKARESKKEEIEDRK